MSIFNYIEIKYVFTQITSFLFCFEKKFLKHLIRCGKSEKNHNRRLGSTMCSILVFSSFTPNKFHIVLFHDAPSHVIPSTFKPDLSARIVASNKIWCKTVPVALPLLRKHPNV